MIPFEQTGYRTQVRRLRGLALQALNLFEIDVASVQFVNHGENTTFKIIAKDKAAYLLRIHRNNYHSPAALREEITWLKELSRRGFQVPKPVRSRNGRWVVAVELPGVGSRHCDVFHWIEGRFLSKSISEADMSKIGEFLAKMQMVGTRMKCTQRRYWTSEGLVGSSPKFGSLDRLQGIRTDEQRLLTATRKKILARLKSYEKRHPEKMGLIHADLHFNNLLKTKSGAIAAIDFDDCGFGFHVYDLVIPLISVEYHLRENKRHGSLPRYKKALLNGYSRVKELTARDLDLLENLIIARKLLMLGWLQSRSDNPKLKIRILKHARRTLKEISMRGL